MDKPIAYCGLDCTKCEAYKATINNDDELRKKVAKSWSELNHCEITPEMINCLGCQQEGIKTPFCANMCPIRKCASGKKYSTCCECPALNRCSKVSMVISHNDEAKNNLTKK